MEIRASLDEIKDIFEILKDGYFTGGFVRDLLRGIISRDVDIIIEKPLEVARKTPFPWFVLDEEREILRIIVKRDNLWQIDLSPIGESVEKNLLERDFTVDSIAFPVNEWRRPSNFIDPASGRADLEKKVVKMVSPEIFASDPVRLYRAFRIASFIDGRIEGETLEKIMSSASLIQNSPGERIKEELFKILSLENSAKTLEEIFKTFLFHHTFVQFRSFDDNPEHYFHKGGLWEHSIETVKSFEKLLREDYEPFSSHRDFLRQYFTTKRTVLSKLGMLLHDIGKPETVGEVAGRMRFFNHEKVGRFLSRHIMERLKASVYEKEFVSEIVFFHMRPSNFSHGVSKRAYVRFFRSFRTDAGVATVIAAWCDRSSYEVVRPQVSELRKQKILTEDILDFYRKGEEKKVSPLISGFDVMEALKIPPSPLVGRLLAEVEEARAENSIKTREEALNLVKKLKDSIPLSDVTIIVPAYNEEATIGKVLEKMKKIPSGWDVLVVDDGSSDGTSRVAYGYKVKVIKHSRNMGKGEAIKTGIKNACGKFVAIQDADLEYNFDELKDIIFLAIREDIDAVYGSRFLRKNPTRYLSFYLGNVFVSFFISALFGRRVTDSYTCYKVIKRKILQEFQLSSKGFEIESEITSRLLKKGVRILEVPISYSPRGISEGKKIAFKDALKAVWWAFMIRLGLK